MGLTLSDWADLERERLEPLKTTVLALALPLLLRPRICSNSQFPIVTNRFHRFQQEHAICYYYNFLYKDNQVALNIKSETKCVMVTVQNLQSRTANK